MQHRHSLLRSNVSARSRNAPAARAFRGLAYREFPVPTLAAPKSNGRRSDAVRRRIAINKKTVARLHLIEWVSSLAITRRKWNIFFDSEGHFCFSFFLANSPPLDQSSFGRSSIPTSCPSVNFAW